MTTLAINSNILHRVPDILPHAVRWVPNILRRVPQTPNLRLGLLRSTKLPLVPMVPTYA